MKTSKVLTFPTVLSRIVDSRITVHLLSYEWLLKNLIFLLLLAVVVRVPLIDYYKIWGCWYISCQKLKMPIYLGHKLWGLCGFIQVSACQRNCE